MHLTCNAGELSAALKIIHAAVPGRASTPILSHVLIEAADDQLTLTGTNLNIAIRTTIPADVIEHGITTTSEAKLAAWIALQPSKAEVVLKADEKIMTLAVGRNRARFGVADPQDFPPAVTVDGIAVTVPGDQLARGIELALPSVAKEESRPILSGLLLKFDGDTLTCAGADGHRLGVARLDLEQPAEPFTLVVPRANMAALAGLLDGGDVVIQANAQQTRALFTAGDTTLCSSLLSGVFPDFERAVPRDHKGSITVPSAELSNQIQAALLTHSGSGFERAVQFRANEEGLKVWARSTGDLEEHEGFVSGEFVGEPVEFALNGGFTVEALKALGSESVVIGSNGPQGAALLTTPDGPAKALQVVMAMWVDDAKARAA